MPWVRDATRIRVGRCLGPRKTRVQWPPERGSPPGGGLARVLERLSLGQARNNGLGVRAGRQKAEDLEGAQYQGGGSFLVLTWAHREPRPE